MGNKNSTAAMMGRLDMAIPRNHDFFTGHEDRMQFLQALRALLSSNGQLDLRDKRFALLYTRAPPAAFSSGTPLTPASSTDFSGLDLPSTSHQPQHQPQQQRQQQQQQNDSQTQDRVQANLVARAPGGAIVAKIVPDDAGADQADAFRRFRRHVEMQLHRLLESIPAAPDAEAQARRMQMMGSDDDYSEFDQVEAAERHVGGGGDDGPPSYAEAKR